jgi:hypothetical protein
MCATQKYPLVAKQVLVLLQPIVFTLMLPVNRAQQIPKLGTVVAHFEVR